MEEIENVPPTPDTLEYWQDKLTALVREINKTFVPYGMIPHAYDLKSLMTDPDKDFGKDYIEDLAVLHEEIRTNSSHRLKDLHFDYAYFSTWPSDLLDALDGMDIDSAAHKRIDRLLVARGNKLVWHDAKLDGVVHASTAKMANLTITVTPISYQVFDEDFLIVTRSTLDPYTRLHHYNIRSSKEEATAYVRRLMIWRNASILDQQLAG